MAARVKGLNRKARTWVVIAVIMLLAIPVYLAVKFAASGLVGHSEPVPFKSGDELVILRDGSTLHVASGSTGKHIADWLERDVEREKTFSVSNANFQGNSTTLTDQGWTHLAQIAQFLKAHHRVEAMVLFSPHHGDRSTLALEQVRADRIRDEVLRQGVDREQIVVAAETFNAAHEASHDDGLALVLTNRA